MGLHEAIVARADGFAGLTAVIGSPPRIYPTEAPQNVAVPYVTYQQVSGARVHAMGADPVAQPRIQFDCFGATRAQVRQVRDQVLACFDRWSGVFAGVTVLSALIENEGIDVERDDTTLIPRETVDVLVSYLR